MSVPAKELVTYLIKVRAGNNFFRVRNSFIKVLKAQPWIISVEPLNNKLCFYIDTIDPEVFENFISHINKQSGGRQFGKIIYSLIHNVYTSKKGIPDVHSRAKTGS